MPKTEAELKKGAKQIKSALEKHKAGKCKIEKVMKAINKYGKECINLQRFDLDDLETLTGIAENADLADRRYEKGDNSERSQGFTRNPYHNVLGKFFQNDIKIIIRKALATAEWWIEHKYDRDAFVYDSEWLQCLDKFAYDYIEERFQHAQYKLDFMHQIRHIVLFIAKEDPFYTCVLKEFVNRFVVEFAEGFELTESERYSLDMWHTGTNEEIRERELALQRKKKR
jgi:hypothetical protein